MREKILRCFQDSLYTTSSTTLASFPGLRRARWKCRPKHFLYGFVCLSPRKMYSDLRALFGSEGATNSAVICFIQWHSDSKLAKANEKKRFVFVIKKASTLEMTARGRKHGASGDREKLETLGLFS